MSIEGDEDRSISYCEAMPKTLRTWLTGLALVTLLIWISIWWIDRPVAFWVAKAFGQHQVPVEISETPILSGSLIASLLFVVFGLVAIAGRHFSKPEMTAVLCIISTLADVVVKDQLKFVFGRTWPDSWGPGVLSLVQNNAYGFHFFHSGNAFESFPSGHASVAAAFLAVPYIVFPRLRRACVACLLAVDAGLVLLNLHFVSDVIAGNFVGFSAGLFIVAFWRGSVASNEK